MLYTITYDGQTLVGKKRARYCYARLNCKMTSYRYGETMEEEIVLQASRLPVCIYHVDDEIYITYTSYFNHSLTLTEAKILWESDDNLTQRVLAKILN